jgi:hypothetical protein
MQLWRYGQPIESLGKGRYLLEGKLVHSHATFSGIDRCGS